MNRVLMVSTPGLGHIYPMVPLARALVLAGHDVRWAVPPGAAATIEQLGMLAYSVGIDRDEVMRRVTDAQPGFFGEFFARPPRERRLLLYPATFVAGLAPPMLDDLRVFVDEWAPDVIVHEPNAVAAPPVAAALDVRHVVVGFGGFQPEPVDAAAGDAMRELWSMVDREPPPWGGLYDDLYLHPLPPSLGPEPFEPTIQPMRPMGFDGADSTVPRWLDRLGRERPLVYVTFGTEVAGMAPFGPVVEGVGDLAADIVVTVGRSVDPESIAPRPDNVRIEAYVPQRVLLDRAALVISHAGSGAVLGAATKGLPQLCCPIAADQFENADAVVAAGNGLALDPEMVDAASVNACARRVLDSPEFVSRARAIATEIAAMPEPAAVVPLIDDLVEPAGL